MFMTARYMVSTGERPPHPELRVRAGDQGNNDDHEWTQADRSIPPMPTPSSSLLPPPAHTQAQACDRTAQHAKAVEVGEAMLAAGVAPLPRAIKLVLRNAHRGALGDRVRGSAGLRLLLARSSNYARRMADPPTRPQPHRASPSSTRSWRWESGPARRASGTPSAWRPNADKGKGKSKGTRGR